MQINLTKFNKNQLPGTKSPLLSYSYLKNYQLSRDQRHGTLGKDGIRTLMRKHRKLKHQDWAAKYQKIDLSGFSWTYWMKVILDVQDGLTCG